MNTFPQSSGLLSRNLMLALVLAAGLALTGGPATAMESELPTIGTGVSHLMTNLPATFNGMDVRNFLGADRFYNAGITGQGTIAANVEAGHIWNSHETLGHVSAFTHNSGAWGTTTADLYDRHATWVGMMIGGRNGGAIPGQWQTGLATGTDLRSGALATKWNNNAYSLSFNFSTSTFTTPFSTYFGTADVINSSWGFTDTSGSVNPWTWAMDGWCRQNPGTTFVVSAGNSGDAPNTVGSPGSGYNAITVGALGNANNYDTIASFSSRGPQDYWDPVNGGIPGVRAAVDIAAPGTSLTSAYYGGQAGGNNATLPGSPSGSIGGPTFYSSGVAGTSFASPITAGAAALIDSASYNTASLTGNANSRDSRVVKAVLLNSADKTLGWSNGQIANPNGLGGVLTSQSLDWKVGAGRLNLDQAYDQYLSGTTDVAGTGGGLISELGWDYGEVNSGSVNDYLFTQALVGGSTFTATLSWMRDRAISGITASDLAQSDLNLVMFDATGGVYTVDISRSISLYNVVEHLSFVVPTTGLYGIRVDFPGMTFGTADSEAYGLAWSGTAVPEPATLAVVGVGFVAVLIRRRRG